ncbi:LysO family transporter [Candidatus Mcinerneyibacteriota bacterium]|nr:LysO family transporter [Candidatus Mcinerneyibacteriota bacterium]
MTVILFLVLGLLIGWKLKLAGTPRKIIHQALTLSIWILLFFMGLDIGSDKNVLQQWGRIGGKAAVITFFSLLGSFAAGFIVWKKVMDR